MSTPAPRVGIPLRPDPSAVRRAGITALMRTATAHLLAAERPNSPKQSPVQVAERLWPTDRDAGWLTRGAVSPASTSNTPQLVQTLVADFIASLSPLSAAAALLERCLQLRFDGNGVISVPGFVADASLGGFVAEGQPVPVRQLQIKPMLLEPSKLAVITPMTREMVEGSNVQAMATDGLSRSMALALDVALFGTAAATTAQPAGLRNGIPAILPASTATDPLAAMLADVGKVLGAVSAVAGNTPPVLVAAPGRASVLRLYSPGGLSAMTVLASSAVAAGDLIAIAPVGIVSATDSTPQISVSRESVLHMSDAPQQLTAAGTPPVSAAPSQSLWQTDVMALRLRMEASWARRDDRAVSWLTATNW